MSWFGRVQLVDLCTPPVVAQVIVVHISSCKLKGNLKEIELSSPTLVGNSTSTRNKYSCWFEGHCTKDVRGQQHQRSGCKGFASEQLTLLLNSATIRGVHEQGGQSIRMIVHWGLYPLFWKLPYADDVCDLEPWDAEGADAGTGG